MPPFLMCCFSGLLANAPMGFLRKGGLIRLPKVTVTRALTEGRGDSAPQASTGAFTVIADDKGENMACPP